MKHARFYGFAALLFAAVTAVPLMQWSNAFGQDKGKDAAPDVKWEYKVIRFHDINVVEMQDRLNSQGEDGWECVSTVSESRGPGITGSAVILRRLSK